MKKNFFSLSFFLTLFYLCSCNYSNTAKAQSKASTEPELKSIFINGDSIHYIDKGKGAPVVFVHGALSDYRSWRLQIDAFAKKHRVIAYSRRYAWPNQQTIIDSSKHAYASHVKDLAEFLKALKLEPAHLVGLSSGAFIALLTGMEHPELVRSLTLAEPPVVSLLPAFDANQLFGPVAEAFMNNEPEKAAKFFINTGFGDSTYFSRLSQLDREIIMKNPQELRAAAWGQDFKPTVTCKDLEKVKIPVLLLGGDKSPGLFINSKIEPCLSNKEKAILLNTNHGMAIENPTEFNKAVLGFIDKH